MKSNLTETEFYMLQSLKAKEALAAERIEGTRQEGKLLEAVSFMASIAHTATTERTHASERSIQAAKRDIQNALMEFGLHRKAKGTLEDWSVEIGDSPESSFFIEDSHDEES